MALIKCIECGNEISDKAVKCPYCGHLTKNDNANKTNGGNNQKKIVFLLVTILIILIVAIVMLTIFLSKTHDKSNDNVIITSDTTVIQQEKMEINAYIYDNDGDFTNIRNAPKGQVIDKIPTGQGRFGFYIDDKVEEWFHIRGSKVYDIKNDVVRELNGKDCWVHESIVVIRSESE